MKRGFTLIDTLMTMAILGIIFTLTVPVLINNVSISINKTKFKSDYALVNKAFESIYLENSDLNFEYFSKNSYSTFPELQRYLVSVIEKDYSKGYEDTTLLDNKYKDMAGNPFNNELMDDGEFQLVNGSTIYLENYTTYGTPLMIFIDTNGVNNPPNVLGKDLFGLEAVGDILLPMGEDNGTQINCGCSKTPCVISKFPLYGDLNMAGSGCSLNTITN